MPPAGSQVLKDAGESLGGNQKVDSRTLITRVLDLALLLNLS